MLVLTETVALCDPPSQERLAAILGNLVEMCAIDYDGTDIWHAGMSLHDRPKIAPYVREIAADLGRQITASCMQFDAVADCPRGGTVWAEALCAQMSQALGKNIPLLRLKKNGVCRFLVPESRDVPQGARVLLMDDTLREGYTSLAAAEALQCAGYVAVGFVTPVEIGTTGRHKWKWEKRPVFSTFNREFLAAMQG